MRHLRPRPSALLGAALLLATGCVGTAPSTVPSTPSSPPSPPPPAVSSADTSWQHARVGDGVTYVFSVQQTRRGDTTPRSARGQVTLDVVAVRQPWIWVRVAFLDEAGQPLALGRLDQDQVLLMSTGTTRPFVVSSRGEATSESVPLVGRTWQARRYTRNARHTEGPVITRVYATEPGPLYLTHGLLGASIDTVSHLSSGLNQLTLHALREGDARTTAAPPAMERPLGPGTYYDRRLEQTPTPALQRVCLAAERGFLLRTEGPLDTQAAPCADFSRAQPRPLEDELMSWVSASLEPRSVLAARASATPSTFTVEDQEVPALLLQDTSKSGDLKYITTETHAVDPWAPGLAGLAFEARFSPLAVGIERVESDDSHVDEGGSRLVRWGTWLDAAK